MEHIKSKDIAGWSTPTTYLIGEDTLPTFARCHDRFTRAAPQVRTVVIPDAGHLIPWQQPEGVVSAVRSAIPA